MKSTRFLPLALVVCAMGAPAWAAQDDPHKGHHPAGSNPAPASKATAEKPSADAARMATQTTAMREMHDKLMAAKTPEERMEMMQAALQMMMDRLPATPAK